MSTLSLSAMRTRLRILLADENSKTWKTDSTLDLFLNLAIIQFTTDLPVSNSHTYTIASDYVGDEHTYTLPADFVYATTVRGYFESGAEMENLPRQHIDFGSWDTGDEPRCYMIDWPSEGYLYLPREPQGSTFTLYYGSYHNTWLDEDSDTFDLGRNRWGEQAIYAYAAFLAFNPSSSQRAQLEQWARRGDLNVGNPLEEEARRWLALYNTLLEEHGEVPETWKFLRVG